MSTPNTDWVGRLRHALIRRREPPRSIYWLLIAVGVLYFALRLGAFGGRPGRLLEDLGFTAFDLGVICYGAGFLLYDSRRTLAGLLWVAALLVFMPLGTVLLAVYWYFQGTTLGLFLALVLPTILLVSYGSILWHYRSLEDGDDEQQDSHQYANAEANWLDKTVWTLFATRTRGRAVVITVLGCVLVAFTLAFTRFPFPFVILGVLPLALVSASVSRLLYDRRRTLARLLEAVSLVLLAGFWVFLVVTLIVLRGT